MPTAAGPGVSQFGRTPKGRRSSVASQASCEGIGLKEEANATAAKENVSSQAADRPAATDRALSPAPAPDGSSLQTQRGPNNHRDHPAKQIVAASEAQCEETGSGVQWEDRPALVQEERKEGGGECEENDDRGALLRQKEALEDEVVYLRKSFAEVCSLLDTLQTDRAAEGKGAKSAEGPVGDDDALRTRHLSPRKRCRRQQIEDVFTADGYSDAVPTAPHPSPPPGLESPSPLKRSTANRSGTPSQSLYTCRGSEFSGPSPPSGFGSAGREGAASIPFSTGASPSTSTPASSINRWISSLILTPSGFSFSGQPAPGHARGTAAASVEEGGDVAQRISFFGDKDSSIPRRPRGVASPPDHVPSEADLFREDSAGQDLLARAKALIQDTSTNASLPEDQESMASVPGPHTPSRHGRKLLACREAGAADKTSHEIAMEELERAMAEKEAACEKKLADMQSHLLEADSLLSRFLQTLRERTVADVGLDAVDTAPESSGETGQGAEDGLGVLICSRIREVERLHGLYVRQIESGKSAVLAQNRQLEAHIKRLHSEYAIELEVLHGALEQGAERIAHEAVAGTQLGSTGEVPFLLDAEGGAGAPTLFSDPAGLPQGGEERGGVEGSSGDQGTKHDEDGDRFPEELLMASHGPLLTDEGVGEDDDYAATSPCASPSQNALGSCALAGVESPAATSLTGLRCTMTPASAVGNRARPVARNLLDSQCVDDSTVEICPHDGFTEQGSESQLATPSPRQRSALVKSPSSPNGMQSPSSPRSLPSSALVRSEVVESWSARMSLPPSMPASARSASGLGLEGEESRGHDGGRAAWDDTCMASLLHADTPMSSRNGGVTSGTGVSTPLEPPVPTLAPVRKPIQIAKPRRTTPLFAWLAGTPDQA